MTADRKKSHHMLGHRSPFLTNNTKENSRTHLLAVLWTVLLLDSHSQRRCDEFPRSQLGKKSWTCSHISCYWGEITSFTHFDGVKKYTHRHRHTHIYPLALCLFAWKKLIFVHLSHAPCLFFFSSGFPTQPGFFPIPPFLDLLSIFWVYPRCWGFFCFTLTPIPLKHRH